MDLFSGSGALGLEALSRGARHIDFVETTNTSLRVLRANIAAFDAEDRVTVHRADAIRFAERLQSAAFDIALADPPYGCDSARRLVSLFDACPFAGVLGIEHRAVDDIGGHETRRYGDTALTFCYAP